MSEWEDLFNLQAVDTELFGLREEEESLPLRQELEEKEGELAALEEELVRLRQELVEARDRQRQQEQRIEDLATRIAGEEKKLYGGTISNPKELRSIQAEVQSFNRKRDHEENILLEHMEKVEELEGAIAGREEGAGALEAGIKACRAGLEEELARIARARGEAEERKAGLSPGISAPNLKLYEELLASKGRLAVVKVVDGVCQGCHMSLPAQEYDTFLKSDGLLRCSNCRRIMVK
jgi:uncharacterized protein